MAQINKVGDAKYSVSDKFKNMPLAVELIPDEKEGFAKVKQVAVNQQIEGYEATQKDLEYLFNRYQNSEQLKDLITKL